MTNTAESMTANFMTAVQEARAAIRDRLARLARGEELFGTKEELEGFLENLDVAVREVTTGQFRYPKGQRRLECVHAVGDSWPFTDPVGLAVARVGTLYDDF